MSTAPTDIELMARLAAGDREALGEIIRRHQRPLVNFFRRMGARTHEVEDLAQETFLRLYEYRERYRPTGKFTNFLFVLARHAWADLGRKSLRTPVADEEAVAAFPVPSRLEGADARLDVQQALTTLSDKLRIVVVLNIYQHLTYAEIAEVLDLPLGTVKSRMFLAMRELREHFDVRE